MAFSAQELLSLGLSGLDPQYHAVAKNYLQGLRSGEGGSAVEELNRMRQMSAGDEYITLTSTGGYNTTFGRGALERALKNSTYGDRYTLDDLLKEPSGTYILRKVAQAGGVQEATPDNGWRDAYDYNQKAGEISQAYIEQKRASKFRPGKFITGLAAGIVGGGVAGAFGAPAVVSGAAGGGLRSFSQGENVLQGAAIGGAAAVAGNYLRNNLNLSDRIKASLGLGGDSGTSAEDLLNYGSQTTSEALLSAPVGSPTGFGVDKVAGDIAQGAAGSTFDRVLDTGSKAAKIAGAAAAAKGLLTQPSIPTVQAPSTSQTESQGLLAEDQEEEKKTTTPRTAARRYPGGRATTILSRNTGNYGLATKKLLGA